MWQLDTMSILHMIINLHLVGSHVAKEGRINMRAFVKNVMTTVSILHIIMKLLNTSTETVLPDWYIH